MKNNLSLKEIATKVKETVACGLSKGLGTNIPGKMCVEAAVCYAYGLPHSDNPPCVGAAVRAFKIRLNDSKWSSNEARAEGMKYIAIAQLNSAAIDQQEFAVKLTLGIIKTIIADLAAKYLPAKEKAFREISNLQDARSLCLELSYAVDAAAAVFDAAAVAAAAVDAAAAVFDVAYAVADIADASYAGYAAQTVAAAVDAAAVFDVAYAVADIADAVADIAGYAAQTVAAAADAAVYDDNINNVLTKAATVCLDVLKEMKSEGCEYLYLLD